MIGHYYDTKKIRDDFEKIIRYSQNFDNDIELEGLPDIFSMWNRNKMRYIRAFEGNTVLPYSEDEKVTITLGKEEKDKVFDEFLEECKKITKDSKFLDFLMSNRAGFFDNVVEEENQELSIKLGMKLLRSFSKFFKDKKKVEKLQNLASSYIQKDKVSGYLFLSVDPRDYLTLSENNNHWRSCHSLDGDYREGNLNYMVDSVTVVAYLADSICFDTKLRCCPEGVTWNNKKWRMLIHINEDGGVYYGRQYPFFSEMMLTRVNCWISGIFTEFQSKIERPAFSKIDAERPNLPYNFFHYNGEILNSQMCIDYSDYSGYKDLVSTPYPKEIGFSPKISLARKFGRTGSHSKRIELMQHMFSTKIGEACACLRCGINVVENADGYSFICPECREEEPRLDNSYRKCAWCGRRIYPEDKSYYVLGDGEYCNTCHKQKVENEEIFVWQDAATVQDKT